MLFGNISVIRIDPVLLKGKHFEPDCLPPVEARDLLFYLDEVLHLAAAVQSSRV